MSFPETRHTLIQRLAVHGGAEDWRCFMDEYWFPVCRFAGRWGQLRPDEAEDVAAVTFAGLIQNNLLSRWSRNPSARLRTLLCAIVRNVLSNRARVESGRSSLLDKNRHLLQEAASVRLDEAIDVDPDQLTEFYSAWVDELLGDVVDRLLEEFHNSGRGDCFRVLYGRICEQLTNRDIAEHLGLKLTTVENHYKEARDRLGIHMRAALRQRVERYSRPEGVESEFQAEWNELSEFLRGRGGIERAIREAHRRLTSGDVTRRKGTSITAILTQFSLGPAPGGERG